MYIYSGKKVTEHIINITPYKEDVVWTWISKFVKPNDWVMKEISIDLILKDPAFREALSYELPNMSDPDYYYRYEDEYFDYDESEPVVFYDKEESLLIDGYSRAMQHIREGYDTIYAFVLAD